MSYTQLKGVTQIGEATLSEQLYANISTFFNWGLLGVGSFFNITRPSSGTYGGDYSTLSLRHDRNYTLGRVWESAIHDWVWESGIEYNTQPISISGVYVNNVFYPSSGTGTYAHIINYPLGQVIFNNPIATGSVVSLEYSHRYFHFYTADTPGAKEIMFNSFRVDDSHFSQPESGVWNIMSQNRIELPAVILEVVPKQKMVGLQLGGGQWVSRDILFHVLAESVSDRDKIFDIITYQKDKTILSFDKNALITDNKFPLDSDGSLVSGAINYPEMVNPTGQYFWKKLLFENFVSQDVPSTPPLFRATIRGTIKTDLTEI